MLQNLDGSYFEGISSHVAEIVEKARFSVASRVSILPSFTGLSLDKNYGQLVGGGDLLIVFVTLGLFSLEWMCLLFACSALDWGLFDALHFDPFSYAFWGGSPFLYFGLLSILVGLFQ